MLEEKARNIYVYPYQIPRFTYSRLLNFQFITQDLLIRAVTLAGVLDIARTTFSAACQISRYQYSAATLIQEFFVVCQPKDKFHFYPTRVTTTTLRRLVQLNEIDCYPISKFLYLCMLL